MIIWIIILGFLAGLSKAVRDTVAHHWERSIFAEIENPFWHKWFESNWENKPHHPIWFLWDAWHCFDTLSYAVYIPMILLFSNYFEVGIILLMRWTFFHLLYHCLFIVEDANN